MRKHTMVCAGIDTGKRKLDVAIDGTAERLQVENTPCGHAKLSVWLRSRRVQRIGIEASGGYEEAVVARLRSDRFVVVVLEPARVRSYAQFQLQRAKNDKIDAVLIAACTRVIKKIHAPPDPRLAPFAMHLTLIEQITEDIRRIKTRRESCRDARIQQLWDEEVQRLKRHLKSELAALVAAIRRHRDLAQRLALISSVAGVGLRTAVAILVRMPEIGRLTRGQVAALAGLAPYDDDSGEHSGLRRIKGGRRKLRNLLYMPVMGAATQHNPLLKACYQRLRARGKEAKVALIACMRKLIVILNTMLARDQTWNPPTPTAAAATV